MEENHAEVSNTQDQNTPAGEQESPPTKPVIPASRVRDVMAILLDAVRQAQMAGMLAGMAGRDGVLVMAFQADGHNITTGIENGGAMIFIDGKPVVGDWDDEESG